MFVVDYLTAVDWMLEFLCEPHVVVIMEVRQEVGGAIGYGTITERIDSKACTYRTTQLRLESYELIDQQSYSVQAHTRTQYIHVYTRYFFVERTSFFNF